MEEEPKYPLGCEDFVSSILDEIALEGLEGVTLQALWVRLQDCPEFTHPIDPDTQKYVWNVVKRLKDVSFYELPTERASLVIYNRYSNVDPELGTVLEPATLPENIYPHCAVEDAANGILGSCATYHERKDISSEVYPLSLEEATRKWGSRLVIVGSPIARRIALMGQDIDPTLELTSMQYCILERIGRSRYLGETTQGKLSLQNVGVDAKSIFYQRKFLQENKLVTKQVFHQKSNNSNCSGSLLHLPRFYMERKPKAFYLTERVVELLRTRPNYRAEYEEVRRQLGVTNSLKKLFKTFDFQKFVKTDVKVPYREIYPNASRSEWKHKGNDKEKMIRVMELARPDVNVSEIWMKDDEFEDDEESNGLLSESTHVLDMSLLSQAFRTVEHAGPDGVSQTEFARLTGQTKLRGRTLCRNLLRRGLVVTYMKDVGRQRVSRFCTKKFENDGIVNQQLRKERQKMLEFMKGPVKRPANQSGSETEPTPKKAKTEDVEEQTSGISSGESGDISSQENRPPAGLESSAEINSSSVFKMVPQGITEMQLANPEEPTIEIESGNNVNFGTFVPKCKPRTLSKSIEGRTIVERSCIEDSNGFTEITVRQDAPPEIKKEYAQSFTDDIKTMFCNQKKESRGVTVRLLKRANLIMEAVRTHRVFEDLSKLHRLIAEEEDREGAGFKMDRKSLQRLVDKLSKDGHIKIIRVTIRAQQKEKTLHFVCEPDITPDHSIVQSAVEQARMKLFIPNRDKLNEMINEGHQQKKAEEAERGIPERFRCESINHSIGELQSTMAAAAAAKPPRERRGQAFGKSYGFSPKCVRMRLLHQLLFYVTHEYTGDPDMDQADAYAALSKRVFLTDELLEEMSQVYRTEVDWRMFIPPLPDHAGWPRGWTIMCDVLLRLPLSIFVAIVNINYQVPGLAEYLSHPVRKHYLVKHLPPKIRGRLTAARRYIYCANEVVQRLCFIGLTQFGPQRFKEKDQIFIYVNTRASLLDTTPSPEGYHQVSDEMTYKVVPYFFQTSDDVDRYWYDLWNICVHTSLGGRSQVEGKNITLEVLENKDAMIEAVQPRGPEEAVQQDTGRIPGDHKGAAGLDSAFFAHLKRNWHWSNFAVNPKSLESNGNDAEKSSERREKLKRVKRDGLVFEPPVKKSVFLSKQRAPKKKPAPASTDKEASATETSKETPVKPSTNIPFKRKSVKKDKQRLVPLRRASRKKPYYDAADLTALTLMSKLRVDWTPPEDNLVLLCKVAAMYICPNQRQMPIGLQRWRDILHENIPSSRNKTSRAVQRRILYMMKNPSTIRSVSLCLEELRQDVAVYREFGNLMTTLKRACPATAEYEKQLSAKFVQLVKHLQSRFKNMRSQITNYESDIIPDTVAEFREKFSVVKPTHTVKKAEQFKPVKTVTDIQSAAINSLIYSSLCCVHDKTSWAYHLFNVYQQYPDSLLRATMAKIRNDQMVSLRKTYARTKLRAGNYLPLSNCPYQLSIRFFNLLQTRYQYDIYHECYVMIKKLLGNYCLEDNNLEVKMPDGGATAAVVELLSLGLMEFTIVIPDQLIVLDPRITQQDETYARIVERYRDILRTCNVGRETATSSVLFKKPYLDFLDRDEFWEQENEPGSSKEKEGIKDKGVAKEKEEGERKIEGTPPKKQPNKDKRVSFAPNEKAQRQRKGSSTSEKGDADLASDSEDDNPAGGTVQRSQQNAVARAASRIALYLMREDSGPTQLSETQHAHDFFVVNSCRVECRLKPPKDDSEVQEMPVIAPDGSAVKREVPTPFISLRPTQTAEALDYIQRKLVYHGLTGIEEELYSNLAKDGHDVNLLRDLLDFVYSKYEFGASIPDLLENFDRTVLPRALEALISSHAILRAGVTTIVYVHYTYADAWLIRSKRLSRKERDKLTPTDCKALSIDEGESTDADGDREEDDEVLSNSQEKTGETATEASEDNPQPGTEADDSVGDVQEGSSKEGVELQSARTRRGTSRLKKATEESVNKLDAFKEVSDQVLVAVRPWVRVDGTLNRRVFDRFLGAILGHCLSSPGLSLSKVCDYFDPALQPVHTRELCEVLKILGCIKWSVLHRSNKPALFSKPVKYTIDDADGMEKETDILIEPQLDAVSRLGHFVGDKGYAKDVFRTMFAEEVTES